VATPLITPYSIQVGVAGAGVMGSGIALSALLADMPVTLFDVSEQVLDNARAYIQGHLERKNKSFNLRNLTLSCQLEALGNCGVVIEAIPEDLDMKRSLFARLDALCSPPAVLATNTSTLPVMAIASAITTPERVAGMHFFNPAPVMPLVEIVHTASTSPETLQLLNSLAGRLGKTPVLVSDSPGFIVNRIARPFYGEALRMLGEGVATHVQIDQLARQGAGFRMGPFELMDLIGIDVNFAATQSMFEQSFREPRYRPHPIQAQMVQQRHLGRKTGRGFYVYPLESNLPEVTPPTLTRNSGSIRLTPGAWAPGLVELCRQAGYSIQNSNAYIANPTPTIAVITSGRLEGLKKSLLEMDRTLPPEVPLLCQCADVTLTEIATWLEHPERLVGFDSLFFAVGRLATLIPSPILHPQCRLQVDQFVRSLGRLPIWIADGPGLVLPRLVAMLSNEAAFALLDGIAEADTIDMAMRLGANFPNGPLAWAKIIGYTQIVAVLDHLFAEYHEERYRTCTLLRRWARLEQVAG
jgi:3-hydroxybutyryl-CoA dehydrogenase